MPDSQKGSLCMRNEVSNFESVKSHKERSSSAGACDQPYKHENSILSKTIVWTNDHTNWLGVIYRNVRGCVIQIGPAHNHNRIFARNKSDRTVLVPLQKNTAKS